MKREPKNESWTLSRTTGCTYTERPQKGEPYLMGTVRTHNGVVEVFSFGGDNPQSIFTFVVGGRVYRRTWPKKMTARGLAIVAARFADEIVRG